MIDIHKIKKSHNRRKLFRRLGAVAGIGAALAGTALAARYYKPLSKHVANSYKNVNEELFEAQNKGNTARMNQLYAKGERLDRLRSLSNRLKI
jgi:Holliday junction resolvasome RuvABC DNA-binding subunit